MHANPWIYVYIYIYMGNQILLYGGGGKEKIPHQIVILDMRKSSCWSRNPTPTPSNTPPVSKYPRGVSSADKKKALFPPYYFVAVVVAEFYRYVGKY